MSNHPLSKKQKAHLAQLARQAFNQLDKVGLIDAPGDTTSARFAAWRHAQQAEACGQPSLTRCTQDDYLPLRAHLNGLLGRDDRAFTDHLKAGPENDHADPNDTPEHRDQLIHLINEQIDGTRYSIGYVIAIARNKCRNPRLKNLESLTVTQLTQLLMTIKSRVQRQGSLAAINYNPTLLNHENHH